MYRLVTWSAQREPDSLYGLPTGSAWVGGSPCRGQNVRRVFARSLAFAHDHLAAAHCCLSPWRHRPGSRDCPRAVAADNVIRLVRICAVVLRVTRSRSLASCPTKSCWLGQWRSSASCYSRAASATSSAPGPIPDQRSDGPPHRPAEWTLLSPTRRRSGGQELCHR